MNFRRGNSLCLNNILIKIATKFQNYKNKERYVFLLFNAENFLEFEYRMTSQQYLNYNILYVNMYIWKCLSAEHITNSICMYTCETTFKFELSVSKNEIQ